MRLPQPTKFQRLIALLVLAAVLTFAVATYHVLRLRNEALDTQRNIVLSLARAGAREATNTITVIDRVLINRGMHWQELMHDPQAQRQLQGDVNQLPALRSLSLVDAQGRILASSLPDGAGQQLAPGFIAALAAPTASDPDSEAPQISPPWSGRDLLDRHAQPGQIDPRNEPYFFMLSRRVGRDAMAPSLVAIVNPGFIGSMLADLMDRPEFTALLYRYDGLLLVSTKPDSLRPGSSAAHDPVFQHALAERDFGQMDVGLETNTPLIAAFKTSRYFPLVLQVQAPYGAALARWRTEAWYLGLGAVGLVGLFWLLALRIYRDYEQRQARHAKAEAEIALAARVFDSSYDGIVITDDRARILRMNAAFTRTTGYKPEDALGQTPQMLSSGLHPVEFYAQLWRSLEECGHWQGEIINRRKNGETYHERLAISSVKNAAGRVTHYIGMFADISEIKRQEQELAQARDRAEAANRAKSQFLAMMSHEIRTPLNGILGMAQLLQLAPIGPEEQRDYATTILDSGQMLLRLLNDMLDLSKIEAGQMQLAPSPVHLLKLLHDVVAPYTKPAQNKGIELHIDAPCLHEETRYKLDPLRLRQALNNLISNALKFTPRGQITLELTEARHVGTMTRLRFCVTDTGIGIPADKLDQLFRPFSQVDSSSTRRFGGTGLGLSIVANLARLMGGQAGVESVEGQGSSFWFTLLADRTTAPELPPDSQPMPLMAELELPTPAAQPRLGPRPAVAEPAPPGSDLDAAAPTAPVAPPTPPTPPISHALIWVVEDNPINSKLLQVMLYHLGYPCIAVAEHGQQAVELLRTSTPPALVFMDCQMPVMDGYEATRQIRQWEQAQHHTAAAAPPPIAIVALTATASDAERHTCLEAGMDDFLPKPVSVPALQAMLARWLPADGAAPPPPTALALA
jgi:PAS domain S-box-containing protein